jgi:DNA-directed RNA polymerase III subunit RPC11
MTFSEARIAGRTLTRQQVLPSSRAYLMLITLSADCAKCKGTEAYFLQIQIRSADEPMTVFYKCINTSCGHQWRGE